MTVNALGSGWFRFRGWFVFALVDGMVCERLLFGLSGLVWLYSRSVGGGTTRSVLSVCSFVSCCMLCTVLVSVLSLRAFDIRLDMGDIELAT